MLLIVDMMGLHIITVQLRLQGVYDFSAVDINLVELDLMIILTKVLEDDKAPNGEALTDKQREEILTWTGWGDMETEAEAEAGASGA